MRVTKYIPHRLYGFASDDSNVEVFFHVANFHPGALPPGFRCPGCPSKRCSWPRTPPPPILGETVEVEIVPEMSEWIPGRAPRAVKVLRPYPAQATWGAVETFDPSRGYGFIQGDDGAHYHLHRSEVLDGRIPLPNSRVAFYAGVRQDRPRACHVKVCS